MRMLSVHANSVTPMLHNTHKHTLQLWKQMTQSFGDQGKHALSLAGKIGQVSFLLSEFF